MRVLLTVLAAASLALSSRPSSAATEPASWPPGSVVDEPAAPSPDAHLYVLTFKDQEVGDVAQEVLGAVLKTPFQIDSDVHGPMSFQVEARLTPEQLENEFGDALRSIDATIVTDNGLALVTTTAKARRLSAVVENRPTVQATAAPLKLVPPVATPIPPPASNPGWTILGSFALFGALAAMLIALRYNPIFAAVGSVREKSRIDADRQAVLDRLLRRGEVQPDAVANAKAMESLIPIEQLLNLRGDISDDTLVDAYAAVTGCARWRPEAQPPLDGPIAAPFYAIRRRGLIPVGVEDTCLTLATSDPLDNRAIAEAAIETGRRVIILVGTAGDIRRAAQAPALLVDRSA